MFGDDVFLPGECVDGREDGANSGKPVVMVVSGGSCSLPESPVVKVENLVDVVGAIWRLSADVGRIWPCQASADEVFGDFLGILEGGD
jgi:hypothetical protein